MLLSEKVTLLLREFHFFTRSSFSRDESFLEMRAERLGLSLDLALVGVTSDLGKHTTHFHLEKYSLTLLNCILHYI